MSSTGEAQRLERRITELRAGIAGSTERDAAGELADVDQHQADAASELEDRERTLGLIEKLEQRLHRLRTGEGPEDRRAPAPGTSDDRDGDVTTPLDAPEPREDLSAIPMAAGAAPDDPDVVADPQEDTGEPDIDMPGTLYPDEGGAPAVGRPEPGDALLEDYRPD
ncbi:MAG: hypothetical protein IT200_04395 [Thermoleophilia bacterium]|nr:hypothetical protein [Thermoleophilia bacterium]